MGSINWQKVIVGGLVAGVVLAVLDYVLYTYVVGPMLAGMPGAVTGAMSMAAGSKRQMIGYPVSDVVTGIIIVWLYAAIRPRYGAGAMTGMCAAFAVWLVQSIAYGSYYLNREMTLTAFCIMGIAALIEIQVAGYVGGMMYKEE